MGFCWKTRACLLTFSFTLLVQQVAAVWMPSGSQPYAKFHFCKVQNKNAFIGMDKNTIHVQDLDGQNRMNTYTVNSDIDLYSVSPNCRSLAVLHYSSDGQNSQVTKFDLETGTSVNHNLGGMDISSIVMGNNNIVYLFPPKVSGEYIPSCLDMATSSTKQCSTCSGMFGANEESETVTTRMHPNGQWIYVSTKENNLHRYVVSGSCLKGEILKYDKWGVFDYGNNWWFSHDNYQLFVPKGYSFEVSSDTSQNLKPKGAIDKRVIDSFRNVTQQKDSPYNVFTLPAGSQGKAQDVYLNVYNWPYLSYRNKLAFPYPSDATGVHAHGIHVFDRMVYTYATYQIRGETRIGFSSIDVSNVQQAALPTVSTGRMIERDSFTKAWLFNEPDDYVEFCNVNSKPMMAGLRSRLITINDLSSQSIAEIKTYTLLVPGLRLAFSPDCRTLAVVHAFYITIIDMVTLGTETTIPVPEVRGATSFTLKNDGVMYIFNEGHQKVCFNWKTRIPGSCINKCQSMLEVGGYLNPSDQYLFALQTTPGFNAVKKYSTDQQCLSYASITPTSVPVTGNKLWFADSGNLIVLENGNVLRSQDMSLLLTLSGNFKWQQSLPVSPKDIYTAKDSESFLTVYQEKSLGIKGGVIAPMVQCSYILPEKVFFDSTGTTMYVYGLYYLMKDNVYHTGLGIATQFTTKTIDIIKAELKAEWDNCFKTLGTTNMPWWQFGSNQKTVKTSTELSVRTSPRWKTGTRSTTEKITYTTTTAPSRPSTVIRGGPSSAPTVSQTASTTLHFVKGTTPAKKGTTTTLPLWLFQRTTLPANWSPLPTPSRDPSQSGSGQGKTLSRKDLDKISTSRPASEMASKNPEATEKSSNGATATDGGTSPGESGTSNGGKTPGQAGPVSRASVSTVSVVTLCITFAVWVLNM